MDEIIEVSTYPYSTTVLVELTGRDVTGELVVASYEFDVEDATGATLSPRGTIETAHEELVYDALRADGYTLST